MATLNENIIAKGKQIMEMYGQALINYSTLALMNPEIPFPLKEGNDEKLERLVNAARTNVSSLEFYEKNPAEILKPIFKVSINDVRDYLEIIKELINPKYIKYGIELEIKNIEDKKITNPDYKESGLRYFGDLVTNHLEFMDISKDLSNNKYNQL